MSGNIDNSFLKARLKGHKSQVISLATDSDKNASFLASGSECGQVRLFDLETQKTVQGLKLEQPVSSIVVQKDSNLLYTSSGPAVYAFDLRSPQHVILTSPTSSFDIASDEINQVGIS